MNPLSRALAAFASTVGFHGLDGIHLAALKAGQATARDIRERLGAPAAEWPDSDGSTTWEYPRGPAGTQCWMLTLDDRGVLQKIEQTLTDENFARIAKGWSAEQVRRLLGKPGSEAKFPLKPEVVWEWRIEPLGSGSNAWFRVHFTVDGYVTGTARHEETLG